MDEKKKITKREYFEMLEQIVENANVENKEEIIYFINSQIASIDNKSEKAKERAAAKKAEGDALRETVKSVLTDELQTADEIFEQLDVEDLTIAKVRARLTQLVANGLAEKADIKTEDGKTKKAYKIA